MTTLYCETHWDSPFVFTAFVALTEKGLPFETRALALESGEHKTPEFRARSLTGRVPTLEHDGFWLSESTAIVEYLDEIAPAPRLLTADVRQRARARQIMAWLRSDLAALRRDRPSSTLFYERVSTPLSDAARTDAEKLVRVVTTLLDGRPAPFDEFCIAEADLSFALMRLIANGDPVPEPVRAYATGVWERPSIRAYRAQSAKR